MFLIASGFEFGATVSGAPILPDDGVVDRLAGLAIPDQRGLALVGDTYARNLYSFFSGLLQGLATDFEHRLPDFLRVMLDPAILRVDLCEFLLGKSDTVPFVVKDHRTGTGCPLVDRKDVTSFHTMPPVTPNFVCNTFIINQYRKLSRVGLFISEQKNLRSLVRWTKVDIRI
jgi:hypothetical protein